VNRPLGYGAVALAVASAAAGTVVIERRPLGAGALGDLPADVVLSRALFAVAVVLGLYGLYVLVVGYVAARASKRRAHDARNVLRLAFGVAAVVGVLGALAEQWLGLLVSLGVFGFAITFALQQPLLSLLGWFYIALKRPYSVGDRVRIGEAKGDVIEVDFLVTTIWEVGGELVSTNQPSGRVVTVPNSLVLSSDVVNFGGGGSPYVWNELAVQVAYETDLEFAREVMREEAATLLGGEMAAGVAEYREALAETPVELEIKDGPTVNVLQRESWVELRLRYLVHPREGTRVRNRLYERVLERFNGAPDRVAFPVSRNR